MDPTSKDNPLVYLDIKIGQEFAGRMIIELRKDIVPKTAENFRALCTGERGNGTLGKPLHYKGVRFHKVTRVFVAQSGDVVNNDGTSGESIYGPVFEDENFELQHEEGVVSMANYGKPHTNNSQFVITSVACDNLNDTNVVVGKVLCGLGIVSDMEQLSGDEGQPSEEIVIVDCGEILPGADWGHLENDEAILQLPPYPQDWREKDRLQTVGEHLAILTAIRNAGNDYFTRQHYHDARRKYRKALRYYQHFYNRYERLALQPATNADESGEEVERLNSFAALTHVNMAAVELKLEQYMGAKSASTEAIRLDGDCSKAFYRRAQSQLALQNYEDAIRDLKRSHELLPDNKQILNELNRAKQLLAQYNRVQMEALKKLFH